MHTLYDISIIGFAVRFQKRTGIFRAVEALAAKLVNAEECETTLCAAQNRTETAAYLASEFPAGAYHLREADLRQRLNALFDSATMRLLETQGAAHQRARVQRKAIQVLGKACGASEGRVDAALLRQAQIYHSSFQEIPEQVKRTKNLRRFLTVYDVIPVTQPQYFGNDPNPPLRKILASLGREDFVTAISQATKNDLCEYLKMSPSQVFVTYLAADPRLFYVCEEETRRREVRARYGIPDAPYVLTLSTLEPRKNMDHVIRCFAQVAQEPDMRDVTLVLAGSKGWDYDRIFGAMAEAKEIQHRIHFTGYVADEDLAALYSGAMAFTYMSHYEGFGLPPLEAMQCGVPVITSNTSSLPEVVGEAGITLAPDDADGLCQAMLDLHTNPARRADLGRCSLTRAAQFSWQRCVQDTVFAYQQALR